MEYNEFIEKARALSKEDFSKLLKGFDVIHSILTEDGTKNLLAVYAAGDEFIRGIALCDSSLTNEYIKREIKSESHE